MDIRSESSTDLRLLVRDLERALQFQRDVLGTAIVDRDESSARVTVGKAVWELRADAAAEGPLREIAGLVVRRGAGIELRIAGRDADRAEACARELGFQVLVPAHTTDEGLREVQLVDDEGYVWVACSAA